MVLVIPVVEAVVIEEEGVVEAVVEDEGTLEGLGVVEEVALLGKTGEVIEGVGVEGEVKIWD